MKLPLCVDNYYLHRIFLNNLKLNIILHITWNAKNRIFRDDSELTIMNL